MVENDFYQSYITELRRGSLTLAALSCLKEPHYGYGLLQHLKDGGLEIEANTLYPLLRRLEEQGLLESTWDTAKSRPRKYYLISKKGIEVFGILLDEWVKMQNSIDRFCKTEDTKEGGTL